MFDDDTCQDIKLGYLHGIDHTANVNLDADEFFDENSSIISDFVKANNDRTLIESGTTHTVFAAKPRDR